MDSMDSMENGNTQSTLQGFDKVLRKAKNVCNTWQKKPPRLWIGACEVHRSGHIRNRLRSTLNHAGGLDFLGLHVPKHILSHNVLIFAKKYLNIP